MTSVILISLMLATNASDTGCEQATKIATFDYLEDCKGAADSINSVTDNEYAYCKLETK